MATIDTRIKLSLYKGPYSEGATVVIYVAMEGNHPHRGWDRCESCDAIDIALLKSVDNGQTYSHEHTMSFPPNFGPLRGEYHHVVTETSKRVYWKAVYGGGERYFWFIFPELTRRTLNSCESFPVYYEIGDVDGNGNGDGPTPPIPENLMPILIFLIVFAVVFGFLVYVRR